MQNKRWKKLKGKLIHSEFYRSYLQKNSSLEDFPIINKKIFMTNFDSINTCGIKLKDAEEVAINSEMNRDFSPMMKNITVGLSTGTTGNRGVFLANENERAKWVAAILDRVIGFSLRKRKVAFFLRANSNLYESVNSSILKFHFFDILMSQSENNKNLNSLNPDILVAQASMLCMIARAQKSGVLSISPKKIISVAEVLSPEDAEFISSVFQQKVHQVYQCTEGFLASTCKNGVLHFNEDFLIIEKNFIDEEKKRFYPLITDLWRTTQPVIRYELNDIVTEKKNCTCGNPFTAIESIEGREDDILFFESKDRGKVNLFPDFLRRAIVLSDSNISDYALIQDSNHSMSLFIESEFMDSFSKAELSIKKWLLVNGIEGIEIRKLEKDPHVIGNKKRRIKNENRKTR